MGANKEIVPNQDYERLRRYNQLLDGMLFLLENNKSIASFLYNEGYDSIAIYGTGTIGRILYRELKDSMIGVDFFIDKNAKRFVSDNIQVEVKGILELDHITTDAIIVTPVFDYETIRKDLIEAGITIEIRSLFEVVWSC